MQSMNFCTNSLPPHFKVKYEVNDFFIITHVKGILIIKSVSIEQYMMVSYAEDGRGMISVQLRNSMGTGFFKINCFFSLH
jgi:hypothetical protein